MRLFFYTTILFFIFLNTLEAQVKFSDYYRNGAVRYDYQLVGDFESVDVVFEQTKYLKYWGGNPNYLIEDLDYGNYNYQLFSVPGDTLIFQKGFSPLFWEWQSTAEAFTRKKSFYQSIIFPRPLHHVKLVINTRAENNKWKAIYTDTIRVDNYFIGAEQPDKYHVDTLLFNGESAGKIDIVILPEGYVETEMVKFYSDSKRLTDSLFAAEPFKTYCNRFNVYLVNVPSDETETDVPGSLIYKNTAFNSHFYTFDSPRYLTTSDMKSIYDALDGVAFDHIYLLVNTSRYGGGGFYNYLNVCTADNERSPFVFCHEFGHGFAGLGDEYYTSSTSYEEFFDKSYEPWEPNLTTMVDFDSKWGHLIKRRTPIPTPRDSAYIDKVGVFEGGGYEAKGIYSPVMSCWMKEEKAGGFCPVCQEAIEKVILNQTK